MSYTDPTGYARGSPGPDVAPGGVTLPCGYEDDDEDDEDDPDTGLGSDAWYWSNFYQQQYQQNMQYFVERVYEFTVIPTIFNTALDIHIAINMGDYATVGTAVLGGVAELGTKNVKAVQEIADLAKNAKKSAAKVEKALTSRSLPKPPTGPGMVPKSERDPKRFYTPSERELKRQEQGHKCANGCGTDINESNSAGHHIKRHADGGLTVPENHAEVCVNCHKDLHSGN